MRILFTSTKGTGHGRPLLPYLAEFQRTGHDVQFAAPEQLRSMIEERGVPFSPLSRAPEEEVQARFAAARDMSESEVLKFAIQDFFVRMWAADALSDLSRIVEDWRPDIILRESAEMAAPVVAAEADIPRFRVEVHNSPTERTFITHAAGPLDDLRRSVGLPADDGLSLKAERAFTSFPESLVPDTDRQEWDKPFRVNTQGALGEPTAQRPAWAPDNGRPLVYLTFGTVAGNEAKERDAYQIAIHALGALPINVLLTTGNNMDKALFADVPDNVVVESWVPQSDVFPYASAIVHHCGSGTLIGALAAGLPSVAVPLFADQPSNAAEIERIGAGVAVFDLDAQSLRSAVMRVIENQSFRAASEKVAREISSLPGVEDAVRNILKVHQT